MPRASLAQIGTQILREIGIIGEGKELGLRLEEEVERIDDVEIGDEIDFDRQMVDPLGHDDPRGPVRLGVLLPVEEVARRRDLQRIGADLGPAMGRRPEADGLRTKVDQPVIVIAGNVAKSGADGHSNPKASYSKPSQYGGRAGTATSEVR